MNHTNILFTRLSLFVAIAIGLNACGGTSSAQNNNSSTSIITAVDGHPTFLRAKVAASNYYKPSGVVTDTTPTFEWLAVPNATKYNFGHEDTDTETRWHEYEISASEAHCDSQAKCSYTPNDIKFVTGDEKVWWVRGEVSGKWQAWSKSHVFKYPSSPVNDAIAISPSGVVNTLFPTFTWKPGNGATAYQIGYEGNTETDWTSHTLTADQAKCYSIQCSYTPSSGFKNGEMKNWWVRNKTNNTWSNWSQGLNFTIDATNQPFASTFGVTSIVKVNDHWFGISEDKHKILEDDGSSVTTAYTSQHRIVSSLSVMAGRLYYKVQTNKSITAHTIYYGTGASYALDSYDTVSQKQMRLLENSSITIIRKMNNYMVVREYHKFTSRNRQPHSYYKIDKKNNLVFLGYDREFGWVFKINSVDTTMNIIHVSSGNKPKIFKKKITDKVGIGLEDDS